MKTTITISKEIKDKLKEFGNKRESYSDIIKRLYISAKERQVQELLISEKNTISVQDALSRAKKRWSR